MAANNPGTSGGYKAQLTDYDIDGRVQLQSNVAEITGGWVPTAEDAAGWIYSQQSYDWKGRPLVTTNQDGTQKYAEYSVCGCAGNEMVTMTDEVGRQQKIYSDVLGRQWKTEILQTVNNVTTVYATTEITLNARDQATLVRQFQGNDQSGVYQDTTMRYDGYGRLWQKHVPEQRDQNNNPTYTSYDYNPDDTINWVQDGRGVKATYGYNNNRHLVSSITYPDAQSLPSGVAPTANVTFGYDAAGNRTSMNDGSGSMSYSYDQLSRMTGETKTFTGLSGSYTLNYGYNLAGELTSLSIPFTSQSIGYSYDNVGRLTSVTGNGFSASYTTGYYPNQQTHTEQVDTFISNIAYRAWGAPKNVTYHNTVSESTTFNSRLQPTSYTLNNTNYTNSTIPGTPNYTSMSWTFDYYDDGRLQHAWDATNHWFDRAYSYDHAARLSESTTYRRAEGLPPFPTNPYPDPSHHVLSYDVWSNITNHSGGLYGESTPDAATYSNNRRAGWTYDADGNATTDASYNHTFDATGKSVHASSLNVIEVNGQYQPVLDINETYDGEGQPRSRVQTVWKQGLCCDENGNPGDPYEDTKYSYYVRSSVLGGAVIADLGQGEVDIYAGGERIAKANGSVDVTFEQHNPATGSWVTSKGYSTDRTTNREERDAFGGELPLSTPYGGSSYETSKFGSLLFIDGTDPFDMSSGVEVDGMPVSESQLAHMMDTGSVVAGLFLNGHDAGSLDFTGHGAMGMEYLRGDFGSIRFESWQDTGRADWHTMDLSSGDAIGFEDQDPTLGVVNVYADRNFQLVNASFGGQSPRGGGGPQNPFKGTTVTGEAKAKDPCDGVRPRDLDYSKTTAYRKYSKRGDLIGYVQLTAEQHIRQRHMTRGSGGSQYIGTFAGVKKFNEFTFAVGTRYSGPTPDDSIIFEYEFPRIVGPVGTMLPYSDPTNWNTLILAPDCKTVRSSHPGPAFN
ncbi:MAG TPA: hypothetical protein VE863_10930 [Pyrinomonadaceae bacterium]|jgi:YD repeat-containing protein|nr:hypothetical protein [Pyrinomonadaceae bacterium]